MNVRKHFHQAFVNLISAKIRSLLAVLGILVGTAAVVALLSCGRLATEKALAQFKELGTDLLAISAYQKTTQLSVSGKNYISIEAWQNLPTQIPAIQMIAPYATAYQPISYKGRLLKGSIIGADQSLAKVIKINLQQGNFVSSLNAYEHVCVVGHHIANQLRQYSLDPIIGQQIRIDRALYTIVGVAKPWQENGFFNEDINQSVIIPIRGMILVSTDSKANNAIMRLNPNQSIDTVIEKIHLLLSQEAPKLSIFVRSAKQIIASMESQGQIFTLLLTVIGGISLMVGGIGVMNVMLVSVSERKKEIGIRKAVGARDCDIQGLFLVESVVLALIGGLLGVFLGLAFTWGVAYFSNWPFKLYLIPPIAGSAVSLVTGIFFGFYPARRAAKMSPMTSLRALD